MNDVEAIKEQVRMAEVLRDYHVQFLNSGEPEQIHCPFHGADINRSARFYPENDSVYCWVCDHTWDVIDFVKDKEELAFVETVRLMKAKYTVVIETPDYVSRMQAVCRPLQNAPAEMAAAVESSFVRFADALTHGNIYSIIIAYNECLAEKDDLTQSGEFSQKSMTQWYEASTAKLRMEFQNG